MHPRASRKRDVIQHSPATQHPVTPRPSISLPPELKDQRILNEDHAKHFIQHGAEGRNPYEKIVAKLEGLPVICISALGAATDAFGASINYSNKDFSPLVKSGKISEGGLEVTACLPYEFIAAAAIVAAKLGGPDSVVTSRVTRWAQDSIPNAPKPPSTKLKTGKGAASGGVIPVDLDTTTTEGPGGHLTALKQNLDHRPNLNEEKDITTVQWAKPLEQILSGLNKQPPEFIKLNSNEDIHRNGYLKFKVNCSENGIDQAVYRIDLRQDILGRKATVKPLNSKEPAVQQPAWWNENFGNFESRAREGYHMEYKKYETQTEFQPYAVYARLGQDGSKLPLSGDQDLFFIPRSEKYSLGSLATEVVDTHEDDGVEHLVDKMKAVHRLIMKKDLSSGEIKPEELQKSFNDFNTFLNSSYDYIQGLGTITPYEAYFIIHLNNQIAKIKETYQEDPEALSQLVKKINVDLSIGLKNLKTMDIDLNTAWFKEKPEEMSQRVAENLNKGFHVSPEILELQIGLQGNRNFDAPHSALLNEMKAQVNELVLKHSSDWKIYAKIEVDTPPPTLPGQEPPRGPYYKWEAITKERLMEPERITALMIDTTVGTKRGCTLLDSNGIKSTLDSETIKTSIPELDLHQAVTLKI